jgi:hypothetical protein
MSELEHWRALGRLTAAPGVRVHEPWDFHAPRVEDLGPGRGVVYVCARCDQAWPCDYELELSREEPDHDD